MRRRPMFALLPLLLLLPGCRADRPPALQPRAAAPATDVSDVQVQQQAKFRRSAQILLNATHPEIRNNPAESTTTVFAILDSSGAVEKTFVQPRVRPERSHPPAEVFPGEAPENFATGGVGHLGPGDFGPGEVFLIWWVRRGTVTAPPDNALIAPPPWAPGDPVLKAAVRQRYPDLAKNGLDNLRTLWFAADSNGVVIASGMSARMGSDELTTKVLEEVPGAVVDGYSLTSIRSDNGGWIPIAWALIHQKGR